MGKDRGTSIIHISYPYWRWSHNCEPSLRLVNINCALFSASHLILGNKGSNTAFQRFIIFCVSSTLLSHAEDLPHPVHFTSTAHDYRLRVGGVTHLVTAKLFVWFLGIITPQARVGVLGYVGRIPSTQGKEKLVDLWSHAFEIDLNSVMAKSLYVIHHISRMTNGITDFAISARVVDYFDETTTAVQEYGRVKIVTPTCRVSPKKIKHDVFQAFWDGVQHYNEMQHGVFFHSVITQSSWAVIEPILKPSRH